MKKTIKCRICGKLFCKYGIRSHIWRAHGKGINFKPWAPGHLAWNHGLTAETSDKIKQIQKTYRRNFLSGKFVGNQTGKPLNQKHKDKISKSITKYLIEHPDKVPYKLNHSSKRSNPEIVFENALNSSNITGWVAEYQHSLYSYDFAFPNIKLDIEIDGNTHNSDKVKKIDNRRDIFSAKTGWIVVRFPARKIQRDVISCINCVKELLTILGAGGRN